MLAQLIAQAMTKRRPGQPRKETHRLNFNLRRAAFDVLAAHLTQQGYRDPKGKLLWGRAVSAIAALVVSGELVLPKIEKKVD